MGQKQHSKRQRKQKARASLKRKHGQRHEEHYQNRLDSPGRETPDSNALILTPSCKEVENPDAPETKPPKLSKSQLRKQKKVQEELAKRAQRAQVYATLQQHALSDSQHALMMPAHMLGQSESKRQQLRRALHHQRAGIALPEGSQLERERHVETAELDPLGEAQTASMAVKPSAHQSAARPAPSMHKKVGEEEGLQEEASAQKAQNDGPQPAKRQKISEAVSEDAPEAAPEAVAEAAQPAVQPVQEARRAAAATREALSLQGDSTLNPCERTALPLDAGPVRVVHVQRRRDIEAVRSGLPITGMEQEVMEALLLNDVLVLCGETGCGKTTQVPQFLYEAGYGCSSFPERAGMIGVTQPRRVAAVSTATRVADELDTGLGKVVGYQVRYDRKVSRETALKFMTDGILLRELQEDFLLSKYSAVIIDEAHERSLNTDLLLGLLSRVVPLRRSMSQDPDSSVKALKLLIMSATLRIDDFTANRRLFPTPPPVVHVPARQYPVTVHFNRRTELDDFEGAAHQKVCKIHRQLPPGGILVFLTGQREVEHLCKRLRQAFDPKAHTAPSSKNIALEPATAAAAALRQGGTASEGKAMDALATQDDLDDLYGGDAVEAAGEAALSDEASENEAEVMSEDDMDSEEEEMPILGGEGFTPQELARAEQQFSAQLGTTKGREQNKNEGKEVTGLVHVLPLYANLPRTAQARVFEAPPAGSRLIVVATNVAETSLTIPGMRYVVDAGRSKQKILEEGGSLAQYDVRWISKASAQQRAGRSGRTGPGHCYRLYSSAHFNDTFPAHTPPEILNTSLEGLTLLMKAMHVDKVPHFPFPTPPETEALLAAQKCLVALSALQPASHPVHPLGLTPLGRAMSRYPITPRHARMLLQAALDGNSGKKGRPVVAYAVALAAALSVESPFMHVDNITGGGDEEEAKRRRQSARGFQKKFHSSHGDAITALNVLCAYEEAPSPEAFCRLNYLHARNLKEMAALHAQLNRAVMQRPPGQEEGLKGSTTLGKALSEEDAKGLAAPSAFIVQELRKALAAGWADQVARRARAHEQVSEGKQHTRGKRHAVRYQTCSREDCVFLHPRSNLHSTAPEFVVYTQLISTAKRAYMAGVTAIEPSSLSQVAKPLCTWSGPLIDPPPSYSPSSDAVQCWQHVTFGKHDWPLPAVHMTHEDAQARTAVFATALLEGLVLPVFQVMKKAWSVPTHMTVRKGLAQSTQSAELLHALMRHSIDSRATLAEAWQKDPMLLQRQLLDCLRKGKQQMLLGIWPHAISEAFQQKSPSSGQK